MRDFNHETLASIPQFQSPLVAVQTLDAPAFYICFVQWEKLASPPLEWLCLSPWQELGSFNKPLMVGKAYGPLLSVYHRTLCSHILWAINTLLSQRGFPSKTSKHEYGSQVVAGDKNDCSDEDIFFSLLWGAGTVMSFNIKTVSPKQPPAVWQ